MDFWHVFICNSFIISNHSKLSLIILSSTTDDYENEQFRILNKSDIGYGEFLFFVQVQTIEISGILCHSIRRIRNSFGRVNKSYEYYDCTVDLGVIALDKWQPNVNKKSVTSGLQKMNLVDLYTIYQNFAAFVHHTYFFLQSLLFFVGFCHFFLQ